MSTVVIKIGGGEGIDPTAATPEIAALVRSGVRVVLVHGGSHETDLLATSLGHPTQTITSPSGHQSRRTDRRTLEIFKMVYCGKINKAVVESLRAAGVDAIGLSGIDGGIWTGSRKSAIRGVEDGRTVIIRDDLSGKVESVDFQFLNSLLDAGRVPVLTPPAVTADGIAINVDADRAAAATAVALHADELLLLSNVRGLLSDPADEDSLIKTVLQSTLGDARNAAKGRMKNKVLAAEEALSGGVGRVIIGCASGEHAIERARTGAGTVFIQEEHQPTMNVQSPMSPDIQILHDLVSTPSVSGNERAASEVFVRHATSLGFDAEVDEMNNAVAHRGATAGATKTHIFLLGHIDTVPGEIPVRLEDGVLHGRGSVDAKGPLAAMLIAASRVELPVDARLTVAGAVGEESAGSPGARFLVEQFRPDACIIGEPSAWNGVTLGYKGRLLATATTSRANSHSAGCDPSASDEIASWWSRVVAHVATFNEGRTRAFDIIQSRIQAMSYECDGLNQRATFDVGFRLPRDKDPFAFAAELESFTPEHIHLECSGHEVASATNRNDPVVRALSTAIRNCGGRPQPKLKTGTADLNVVAPIWKCPIAAYGPGDSSLDHTPYECLSLDEYRRSIDVLTTAIGLIIAEFSERECPEHNESDQMSDDYSQYRSKCLDEY